MAVCHPRPIRVGQQEVRADHFPPWSILWSLGLLGCPVVTQAFPKAAL